MENSETDHALEPWCNLHGRIYNRTDELRIGVRVQPAWQDLLLDWKIISWLSPEQWLTYQPCTLNQM